MFSLTVIRVGAVLAGEVLLDEERIHREVRIDRVGDECHLCYLLGYYSMIDSLGWILTPREGTMILDQNSWCVDGVDVVATETVDDHHTCLLLVLGHLCLNHTVGAWDAVVEIVGMGSTDVGDVLASLRPCGSIGAVGVDDTTQFGELTIEHQMGGGIAGGVQVALDDLACLEVYHHHVGGLHHVVVDTGRLDDDKAVFTVYPRHIAPSEDYKVVLHEVKIGLEYFFF